MQLLNDHCSIFFFFKYKWILYGHSERQEGRTPNQNIYDRYNFRFWSEKSNLLVLLKKSLRSFFQLFLKSILQKQEQEMQ